MLRLSLATLVFALSLAACAPSPGRLVVLVESDIAELVEVEVTASRLAGPAGTESYPFPVTSTTPIPFSFAIEPNGHPNDGVEVVVAGYDRDPTGAVPIVTRTVRANFVAGSTRLVRVALTRSCRGMGCVVGTSTCVSGTCQPLIPSNDLPILTHPGQELEDAATMDASAGDAGTDASADLDTGALDTGMPVVMMPVVRQMLTGTGSFGSAVALDYAGTTALVGSPTEATQGRARLYSVSTTALTASHLLTPPTVSPPTEVFGFGASVALARAMGAPCRAVIGAPGGASPGTGTVHGSNCDGDVAFFIGEGADVGDRFGTAVAVQTDGTTIIGVPGLPDSPGDVSVYTWTGMFVRSMTFSDLPMGSELGASVSTSDGLSYAMAGAPHGGTDMSGIARVFFNATTTNDLAPPGAMTIGGSVAMNAAGDRAVVSAAGGAAVYARSGASWTLEQTLPYPDGVDIPPVVAIDAAGGRVVMGVRNVGAWLCVRGPSTWGRSVAIPDVTSAFAVAISGDGLRALIGAPGAAGGMGQIYYVGL